MDYQIRGIFIQVFGGNGVFEGSMQIDSNGQLRGQLQDYYGESEIIGRAMFEQGKIRFIKRYLARREDPAADIGYSFNKDTEGFWSGIFEGKGGLNGEAMCEITEHGKSPVLSLEKWVELAEQSRPNMQTIERWTRGIVERMVEKGQVEIRKDTETGEDLIIPK